MYTLQYIEVVYGIIWRTEKINFKFTLKYRCAEYFSVRDVKTPSYRHRELEIQREMEFPRARRGIKRGLPVVSDDRGRKKK